MTVPARGASKFCATSQSQCPATFFSRAGFFGNSWADRTLARMSTWTILRVMPGCPLGPFWLPLTVLWGPFGCLGAPVGLWRLLDFVDLYIIKDVFDLKLGFLSKKMRFDYIKDPHKQYIQVDKYLTTFFILDFQDNVFTKVRGMSLQKSAEPVPKGCLLRTWVKTCSWKSKLKRVVKCCVYLDILLMGSFYVLKSTFLRGNPISGEQTSLRAPPRNTSLSIWWTWVTLPSLV